MFRFLVMAVAVVVAAAAGPASAAEPRLTLRQDHRDLVVAAVELRRGENFDISVVDARSGIARIIAAIDLLYEHSPFSVDAIRTLRRAGEVILVYDPHFPEDNLGSMTIAAFFPDFYQHDGASKQFVAVVGRYGAKWPPEELAAVLAHELVGHGMQHYRGRLDHVRTIDLECEAYLYEERAYQDLGVDKSSGAMIKFRQALEDHWCKPFRAYLKRNAAGRMKLWERLNPDVPRLLQAYLRYVDSLNRSGVTRQVIDAERRNGLRR